MDEKNNSVLAIGGMILAALVSGFVALQFAGGQQEKRDDASNVGNLPATNANVAQNTQSIIDLREQLTQDIKDAEESSSDDLKAEAQLIRSEINRREPEVLDFVKTLNLERKDDIQQLRDIIDILRDDLSEVRRQEFEHVNSPRAEHND